MPSPRDPRYDVLFESVQIGPVTAKNRFYQVPHCNGMGYRDPSAHARMRAVKAEGGWAVVCTEQAEIHPSSEITPFIELRIWDEQDLPGLAMIPDAIHAHGALAGIELCYNGMNGPNFYSREVPMGPAHLPVASFTNDPVQARAMTRRDIADLRRWHRNAARLAQRAGFDIVYVYAGHSLGAVNHFLSPRYNTRADEYGGSLENRARLLKEVIEDTKDAIGATCAVPVRISVEDLEGEAGFSGGEVCDLVGMLAELPDMWDFVMGSWELDSRTSRFAEEGAQEDYVRGLKALTTKPVCGVGRFTSPDAMVRQVKQGVLDLVGAARPSIADPYLPKKVEEGRIEDIRECIGCNICVSGDFTMSPIRCTQNPTMGEEWRRGWHPEVIAPARERARVLVVGGGPAGMEAALALGRRGHEVTLAEAGAALGGRVSLESALPGLAAWARVRDYRAGQLAPMPNVEVYFESLLDAAAVLEFGAAHVAIATGARWRRDGVARHHTHPIPVEDAARVLTPDDLMSGAAAAGTNGQRVVLYDDDHYYMGGVLAELLVGAGAGVTLVTPASRVSDWTANTLEQSFIQTRLMRLGVRIVTGVAVTRVAPDHVRTVCVYTGEEGRMDADVAVLVTARLPEDALHQSLAAREQDWRPAGVESVRAIGDAYAPGPIAWAVFAGHRYARELGEAPCGDAVPFRRELTAIAHTVG